MPFDCSSSCSLLFYYFYEETSTDEKTVINSHSNKLPYNFIFVCVNVKECQDKLPTMYRLPKLHKRSYKDRFIANSSFCIATEQTKLLTFCLTAVKSRVIRYYEKNMFGP